ncbi:hypothetical protein EUX98_g7839 [Antrodiella citrinella]|uniref:Uncharacterized protein n=1 Tax=Antrodiella citrinella TaxID=2447956 RepID=A0A4S4MSM5_9APHY|nr:hypothetical protein EUX98_g7839 [Antrodiella citrinella]
MSVGHQTVPGSSSIESTVPAIAAPPLVVSIELQPSTSTHGSAGPAVQVDITAPSSPVSNEFQTSSGAAVSVPTEPISTTSLFGIAIELQISPASAPDPVEPAVAAPSPNPVILVEIQSDATSAHELTRPVPSTPDPVQEPAVATPSSVSMMLVDIQSESTSAHNSAAVARPISPGLDPVEPAAAAPSSVMLIDIQSETTAHESAGQAAAVAGPMSSTPDPVEPAAAAPSPIMLGEIQSDATSAHESAGQAAAVTIPLPSAPDPAQEPAVAAPPPVVSVDIQSETTSAHESAGLAATVMACSASTPLVSVGLHPDAILPGHHTRAAASLSPIVSGPPSSAERKSHGGVRAMTQAIEGKTKVSAPTRQDRFLKHKTVQDQERRAEADRIHTRGRTYNSTEGSSSAMLVNADAKRAIKIRKVGSSIGIIGGISTVLIVGENAFPVIAGGPRSCFILFIAADDHTTVTGHWYPFLILFVAADCSAVLTYGVSSYHDISAGVSTIVAGDARSCSVLVIAAGGTTAIPSRPRSFFILFIADSSTLTNSIACTLIIEGNSFTVIASGITSVPVIATSFITVAGS